MINRLFLLHGQILFTRIHLVADFTSFLLHLTHRSLSLTVFIEIADRLIRKILCFFENLVGFFVRLAKNIVAACIEPFVFRGETLL